MPTKRYLQLNPTSGGLDEVALLDSSAGAGDAGKGIALDSVGKINLNMMPTGVGPELQNLVTSEDLSAGDWINVYDNGGVPTARKADATNGAKRAHGFVKESVTSPAPVDVYFDGANDVLTGLTTGTRYFLSATTPGSCVTTPPSSAGNMVQYLGSALNDTIIAFRPTDGVIVA